MYASSENGLIGYESTPFSDEHILTIPQTLLFLVKGGDKVSVGERGEVLVTNLYETVAEPYMVLINYKIGDWAKCVEEDNEIVTSISQIRRVGNLDLGAAKWDPQEPEIAIEKLGELKKYLTGRYFITPPYENSERREIRELRIESTTPTLEEKKRRMIEENIRKFIYSNNYPLYSEVEKTGNARLLIEVVDPGELYNGYEEHVKGKNKPVTFLW
jgi:phenylacetate-coenzyme A ligase PaaK-like adenylate-forming protein